MDRSSAVWSEFGPFVLLTFETKLFRPLVNATGGGETVVGEGTVAILYVGSA